MADAVEYDAILLDVMLPGADGFEVCRTPARARGLVAGADADRARRRRGSRRGARRRRGRLPPEAVLVRRAAGPAAGARAARRGRSARPSLEVGDLRLDPARAQGLAGRGRDPALGEGVQPARGVHAPARPGAEPAPAARARLGLRLREPLERGRRLRPLPAREDRPAVRPRLARDGARRRLPAPDGRAREPAPDPRPADARLRARDGGRARRGRARSSTSGSRLARRADRRRASRRGR